MPLFVTVTPGTTVTSSTTLDASTLNLLGTPSVDVTGTVDGGSLSITSGSVPLTALAAQNAITLVGNASGSLASPTALTSTDLAFATGTVNIGTGAVVEGKIGARAVTIAKFQAINTNKLLGRTTASTGDIEEITVGTGLTLSAGSLTSARPRTAFTNVEGTSTYTVSNVRASAVVITPLTTQITPQFNTSKVLVQFNFSGEIIYTSAFILERVDGATVTPLGVPSSPGSNRIYGTKVAPFDADNGSTQFNMAISFLDSPATTNTISYRLRVYCSAESAAFALNRSIDDVDQNFYMRATSQVILQEILPT
tara:strand:+ start:724 stop:1653 length:930 start_codon:yes stop_codon:yes gene_type:complete